MGESISFNIMTSQSISEDSTRVQFFLRDALQGHPRSLKVVFILVHNQRQDNVMGSKTTPQCFEINSPSGPKFDKIWSIPKKEIDIFRTVLARDTRQCQNHLLRMTRQEGSYSRENRREAGLLTCEYRLWKQKLLT